MMSRMFVLPGSTFPVRIRILLGIAILLLFDQIPSVAASVPPSNVQSRNLELLVKGSIPRGISQGQYLYALETIWWDGDLFIYDNQNPAAPVKLSSTYVQLDSTWDLAVCGNLIYIVGSFGYGEGTSVAMNIFDISNPRSPTLVGKYIADTVDNGVGYRIFTDGKVAYILADTSREEYINTSLIKVDVSNPRDPQTLAYSISFESDNHPFILGLYDHYLYSLSTGELKIYDVGLPGALAYKKTCAIPNASYMALKGNLAYIICDSDGVSGGALKIFDLANPLLPSLISSFTPPATWGNPYTVTCYGGMVSLLTYEGANAFLHLMDASDPAHLAILAELSWTKTNNITSGYMNDSNGLIYLDDYLFRYAPPGAVRVSKISRPDYRADYLRPRNLVYTDRPYEYTAPLPYQGFKEQSYIQTRHDDKHSTGSSFLRFSIDRPATVYVAYDERASAPPRWLAGWVKKGLRLASDDRLSPGRILYARDFPAGEVVLGGNRDAAISAPADLKMYGVLVVPRKAGAGDWTGYE